MDKDNVPQRTPGPHTPLLIQQAVTVDASINDVVCLCLRELREMTRTSICFFKEMKIIIEMVVHNHRFWFETSRCCRRVCIHTNENIVKTTT